MGAVGLFVVGLMLLIAGAELVVRGAARVATTLGISPMVIGLTIVAIGTSTPELAVGVAAGLKGEGGLAVGNVAGANLFVMLVVFGLSALIRPLPLNEQIFKLELPMIVFTALFMTVLAWDGNLSRLDGCLMLLAGIGYTVALYFVTRGASRRIKQEFREEYGPQTIPPKLRATWLGEARYAAVLVAGIVLTVLGANFLVRGASAMALALGVSTTVIGLTIVAIGTSAPELVTTVVCTLKDDRDVAIGNLLGSGIYNILAILSIPCIVTPGGLPVEPHLLWFDIPLMAGVAVGAIPVFVTGRRVSRLEGGFGVACYVAYLLWLVLVRS